MSSISSFAQAGGIPSSSKVGSLERRLTVVAVKEKLIHAGLFLCAFLSVLTTCGIIYVLLSEAFEFFSHVGVFDFLTGTKWSPQYLDKHFGILPLLTGTLMIAGIAGLIGLPLGLASAIYLSEYATPRTRSIIKPILEILAGIPTVVYGYFALEFITPYLLRPVLEAIGFEVGVFNALSAGVVVGIMIIPMVSTLSEDALQSVPGGLREAALALGSSRFDVSVRVLVPAAFSGILASFLLAIARVVGETMAVTIAAGQNPAMALDPLKSIETMSAFIVNISLSDVQYGTVEHQSLYAVALTLFAMTFTMTLISQFIMHRFREKYQ